MLHPPWLSFPKMTAEGAKKADFREAECYDRFSIKKRIYDRQRKEKALLIQEKRLFKLSLSAVRSGPRAAAAADARFYVEGISERFARETVVPLSAG